MVVESGLVPVSVAAMVRGATAEIRPATLVDHRMIVDPTSRLGSAHRSADRSSRSPFAGIRRLTVSRNYVALCVYVDHQLRLVGKGSAANARGASEKKDEPMAIRLLLSGRGQIQRWYLQERPQSAGAHAEPAASKPNVSLQPVEVDELPVRHALTQPQSSLG